MIRKIFKFLAGHFLLRNVIMAVCAVVVFLALVTLMMNFATRHGQRLIVPEIRGMNVEEAREILAKDNLELVVMDSIYTPEQPPGTVLDQSPEPRTTVKSGRKIFLVINSTSPRMDVIPYVAGYSLRQAKNMLETKGFEIKKIEYVDDIATNNVLSQWHKGVQVVQGSKIMAPLGEGVVLRVGRSGNAAIPLVPKVIGLSVREAKSRIWEMGLNLGEIKRDASLKEANLEHAYVYKQMPNQQTRANFGAPITLYITSDPQKVADGGKLSDKEARKVANDVADSLEHELITDNFFE